ncbi:organic cation transporter protein [Nematostella vectensis]|uniref:organic cation transporter protein n=1 Tax=Nematostella vectensis TaxID=45351 RepID=UPI0020770D5F|nr:organic cation transporter protein [Nematostella vectensis]
MEKEELNVNDGDGTKRKFHEFDDVFVNLVRSFGTYQRLLVVGLNMIILPLVCQFDSLVYALGTPGFHCETANVTCPPKQCCENCTSYVFDGPYHSTVSEWRLICDKAYLGATLQSVYFIGMLFGSFLTGMVSDAWGRKNCLFLFTGIMLAAGVASTLVDCVSFFAFLRFLVGFGLSGAMLSQFIYLMEIVGPKRRTLTGYVAYLFWGGFGLVILLFAYFIRGWRTLLLAGTLPAILLFPFWRWIPESPRWLVANGGLDEAHAVLVKFGAKRGNTIDEGALRELLDAVREDQLEREKDVKKHTALDLLKTPKLRRWTLNICFQWFAVALVNFGIFIFVSQLAGNLYVNYAIMRTLTTVRVPPLYFLTLKFGRRLVHGSCLLLGGTILLIILGFHESYPLATTGLAVTGFMVFYCAWTTTYLITAELFPTVLRNTAQGVGSTAARIGAMLAPYIAMSGQLPGTSVALPATICGVIALIAAVATYWIPETLYANMHQTAQEAERAEDDYGIPCCGGSQRARWQEEVSGKPLMMTEKA